MHEPNYIAILSEAKDLNPSFARVDADVEVLRASSSDALKMTMGSSVPCENAR